ncbi:SAM-dependent methyltransferase [Corynebacterium sp. HMSC08D02]|uniref:THUMP-like domain-containing protein n=1 Tax=Corynebacterium sp. HMSC08D02 TaxID=1581138 RepID=UPI0008A5C6DA|nr:SAM-dependent methyltransferase [Corynebacterium sp. HMSC08D02]OFT28369.1 SAM-dependent methyltransferase [Corynebacterium sp. HMSC08D02]
MSFTLDEVGFLRDNLQKILALGPDLELIPSTLIRDRAVLEKEFGDHARVVSELLAAQRSARGKMPEHWLTDSDAAQQATPQLVAEYRAQLIKDFGAATVHDVTCSVGSEGASIRKQQLSWIGSDLDRVRLAMAQANLADANVLLCQADALQPISSADVIVADPARRANGRRITDPAKLLPPLPDLVEAHRGRELAVKCAPGIDYSEWSGLVSVVSLDGGVKETCLYTEGFRSGIREAVVLRADGSREIVRSDEPDDTTVAEPGTWMIEPDGAIIRAGLVRHWAHRHKLWMVDPHIAFLTGDELPAATSGFRFLEAVPFKRLKAALANYQPGALEILVRGVDVNPDQLRKKMKLKGHRQMAVLIARTGNSPTAYICEAREHQRVG